MQPVHVIYPLKDFGRKFYRKRVDVFCQLIHACGTNNSTGHKPARPCKMRMLAVLVYNPRQLQSQYTSLQRPLHAHLENSHIALRHPTERFSLEYTKTSVFVSADASVKSLRKLFIFTIKKYTPNFEKMRFLTTYSASRAGKTFCWDKLRCQFFQGGLSTTKKKLYQNRFSKKYREVPFGGSRSQEVFARVRPQEPVLGQIARACRCVWSCMCTSFFFFAKSFQVRCRNATYASRMLPTISVFGCVALQGKRQLS